MEHPNEQGEQFPDDIRRRLRLELIEDLPESPSTASPFSTELRSAIQSAVMTAHINGRALDDDDAHIIAEFLSFAIERPHSHLANFGQRRRVDYDHVIGELRELASRPTLRLEIREVTNWLASHLLYQQAPELRPNTHPGGVWEHHIAYQEELGLTAALHINTATIGAGEDAVFERVSQFILEHGVPALAYLRLPGTDAAANNLDTSFRDRYIASFPTLDAAGPTIARHRPGTVSAVDVAGEVHLLHRYP